MSEEMNNKIKQITEMLGQEKMPENLKNILSLLTSSAGGSTDSSSKAGEPSPAAKEEKQSRSELDENMDMLRKMKKIMDRMSTASDARVNLLLSIKPFLNSKRQKKLQNCVNILRLSNVTRMMDENDK